MRGTNCGVRFAATSKSNRKGTLMNSTFATDAVVKTTTTEVEPFLSLLWRPGEIHELRVPKYNRFGNTGSGYFDSPHALAEAATKWDGIANIFVTLNPVNPALLARARNRVEERATTTTSDADIAQRRWLFIDIDAIRPSGISSTDEELAEARVVCYRIRDQLSAMSWPRPAIAMSGNGYYLLYPVTLPNDAPTTRRVEGVLRALAAKFDTATAKIDTSVSNASRLVGVVGTLKVKGDSLPNRPHRRSYVESLVEAVHA